VEAGVVEDLQVLPEMMTNTNPERMIRFKIQQNHCHFNLDD
jgi:hypothetical protein